MKPRIQNQQFFYMINKNRCILLRSMIITITILMLASCNLPNKNPAIPSGDAIGSMVAATGSALTPTKVDGSTPESTPYLPTSTEKTDADKEAQTPTITPTSSMGKVTGLVCFNQGTATDLVVYFQNTGDNLVTKLPITVNNYQVPYASELIPGNYIAYAWNLDFSSGGT